MGKIITAILISLITGCKSSQVAANLPSNSAGSANRSELSSHYCEEITEYSQVNSAEWQECYVLDYRISRGCACVKFQYSGCQKGNAYLLWDGKWDHSIHPEILLKLKVSEAGFCDQLLTDSTCFSLKKLSLTGNEIKIFLNSPENVLQVQFN